MINILGASSPLLLCTVRLLSRFFLVFYYLLEVLPFDNSPLPQQSRNALLPLLKNLLADRATYFLPIMSEYESPSILLLLFGNMLALPIFSTNQEWLGESHILSKTINISKHQKEYSRERVQWPRPICC